MDSAGGSSAMSFNTGYCLGVHQLLHVGVDFHCNVGNSIFEDLYLHFFFFGLTQEAAVSVHFSPQVVIVELDEGVVHPCLPRVVVAEYAGVVGVPWCL